MKYASSKKKDKSDIRKVQNLLLKDKEIEKEDMLLGEEDPEENLKRAGYNLKGPQQLEGDQNIADDVFLDEERSLNLLEQVLQGKYPDLDSLTKEEKEMFEQFVSKQAHQYLTEFDPF